MANNCKDCDRLQAKQTGTAPERPTFNQPTMYDHFAKFQKFKQAKEEEESIRQRKEELMKFSSNFTNFNLNRVISKEEFDQFSTQDIATFRRQMRMENWDGLSSEVTPSPRSELPSVSDVGACSMAQSTTASTWNQSEIRKKKSLLTLTRTPVQCPISTCNRTIGVTSVLTHYLRDHNDDFGVECQEITPNKRSVLIFDPTNMDYRENVCLGVLAYGSEERAECPAERGLCIHNSFLPKPHEHLDAHLAILIMACRTSWTTLLMKKELEKEIPDLENCNQELLVIWLASVQTTKPVHCTVTVYDKLHTTSRSSIMQVRNLSDSQNPSEFVTKDVNCLSLNHGEIVILSNKYSECIQMEILINEYEEQAQAAERYNF